MELAAALALPVLLAVGMTQTDVGERFHFALPYFQDNLFLMMVMSGIFGALRVIGAIGILRNRMWGLALSVIMCVVTLVLMIFMLPPGIADGILSGGALVLILVAWFGSSTIPESIGMEAVSADSAGTEGMPVEAPADAPTPSLPIARPAKRVGGWDALKPEQTERGSSRVICSRLSCVEWQCGRGGIRRRLARSSTVCRSWRSIERSR